MILDIRTVLWREWRQYLDQIRNWQRTISRVLIMAVALIILDYFVSIRGAIDSTSPGLLIWVWAWLPLGNVVTLAIDAFAGDRERHTLETLLATRLPERAILIGKVMAVIAYAWTMTMLLATGIFLALNISGFLRGKGLFIYPARTMLIGPPLGLLMATVGGLVAVHVSLKAPTVRQANLRLLIVTTALPVLLFIPLLALALVLALIVLIYVWLGGPTPALSMPDIGAIAARNALFIFGLVALLILIVVLFKLAEARFDRARMIYTGPIRSFREQVFQRESHTSRRNTIAPPDVLEPVMPNHTSKTTAIPYGPPDPTLERQSKKLFGGPLRDIGAVIWKEGRETRMIFREWRGWFIFLGILFGGMGLQISFVASDFWVESAEFSLVWWLAMAGLAPLVVAQRISDAVAGERERHTGEVLFSTRISGPALLIGKVIAAAVFPWLLSLAIPLTGLLAVNLAHWGAGPYFYPWSVLLAGGGFTLLIVLLLASIGLLISLQAATVQQAARRLAWIVVPYLLLPGLAMRRMFTSDTSAVDTTQLMGDPPDYLLHGDLIPYLIAALPVLASLTFLLLVISINRFKRGQIVFD